MPAPETSLIVEDDNPFTMEKMFGTSVSEEAPVLTEEAAQEKTSTETQALLENLMLKGEDPRKRFPAEKGWVGQEDVFGYETEKGFSPEVRAFVRKYYGPAEIQYDPDAGMLENLWTRMFGSAPTEEEKAQIAQAQTLYERGGQDPSARHKQAIQELLKGRPSSEDMAGRVPEEVPPWLEKFASQRRQAQLPKTQAKVLAEDYGLQQPTDVDNKTIARGRDASVWANQLEELTPGLAQKSIGPILASDFNERLKLEGKSSISPEELDIKQTIFQGDKLLTFVHPVTKKRTLLDPVKLEWQDVAEILPEAMVVAGDIAGMGAGSIGYAVGPKTGLAGNIAGGALGAFAGRMYSIRTALEKHGFAENERYGGWTKEGFIDSKTQEPHVITLKNILLNAKDDALWSAAGNMGVRLAFKLGKSILTRGAPTLKGELTEEQFVKAAENWRKSRLGTDLAESGQQGPLSVRLEAEAARLQTASREATGPEALALKEEADQFYRQAAVLRHMEQGTAAQGDVELAKETLLRKGVEGEGDVTLGQVSEATSKDVARAVEQGLPKTGMLELDQSIDNLVAKNNEIIEEFSALTAKGTPDASIELGKSFADKTQAIMGTPTGSTGIYGVFNEIGKALNRRGQKGVPTKPFDLSSAVALVNKLQKGSGVIGGSIGKVIGEWNQAIGRVAGVKDASQIPPGTPINVGYNQLKDLLLSMRTEIGSKTLSQPQIANLSKLIDEIEKIQLRGVQEVDDILGTTYASKLEAANSSFKNLAEVWQRGLTKSLEEGTFANLAKNAFKNADSDFVGTVIKNLKPGKEQYELLKSAMIYNYKQALRGLARGETETAVDVGGRQVALGVEKEGITITPASEAAHQKFVNENSAWIKALFKDGEFDELAEVMTRGANTAKELKNLQTFDETLRKHPRFQGSGGMIEVNQNLGTVIVRDPQLLVDEIFNLKPGDRARGVQALYSAINILPKAERTIAKENMRALSIRRMFNPEPTGIAISREAPENTAFKSATAALDEIKHNESLYNIVFGQSQRKNLEKIFKDLELVSRETMPTSMQEAAKGGWRGVKSVPLRAAKVWVGVLNRRARTLTQTKEAFGEGLEDKIQDILRNPDKAAQMVALSKTNLSTKYGLNAFGQLMGLSIADARRAIAEFGEIPIETIALEQIIED